MHVNDSANGAIVTLFLLLCPLLVGNHQALEPCMLNGIISIQKVEYYIYRMLKVSTVFERGDSTVTELIIYLLVCPGLEHYANPVDTGCDEHENNGQVYLSELK